MASKRILNSVELDELLESGREEPIAYEGTRLSKKYKNSLDSDEEDDEEKAKKRSVMNPDVLEGQEESTIDHDGEIRITPFNMKDELEEGYFDKDGTFIFTKSDEIKDGWLDDIDWVKVKSIEGSKRKRRYSSESEDLPELDVIDHYRKMLSIMEPNETVQNAICRLGGSKKSKNSRRKFELKDKVSSEDKEKLQNLTGFASDILQNGDMDIYQKTYEKLSFLVKAAEDSKSDIYNTTGVNDMFGDDFDEKVVFEKESTVSKQNSAQPGNNAAEESDVMWEFKWELKDDAKIYGPHATSEMLRWVQEGYFSDGVYVRQTNKPDAHFYSSKRIDFELYL